MKGHTKKNSKRTVINVNGVDYDLGELLIISQSYCPSSKKNFYNFKCIGTGKNFSSLDGFAKHVAKHLVDSKKVILTNDKL